MHLCTQRKAISTEKSPLLHLMQITIENNITNIPLFFYPATEIKLYRHQMRWVGGKEITNFCNSKMFSTLFLSSLALSLPLCLSEFLLFFDCGNIKFHCICGWTWIFPASLDDRCCFFSGDYHFCILLSDSLSGIYAIFTRSENFQPRPLSISIFQFFFSRAQFSPCRRWIVEFTDFSMSSVTICWLLTWFCNFCFHSTVLWIIQVTRMRKLIQSEKFSSSIDVENVFEGWKR